MFPPNINLDGVGVLVVKFTIALIIEVLKVGVERNLGSESHYSIYYNILRK